MRTSRDARRTGRERDLAGTIRKAVAGGLVVALCHVSLLQTGWAQEGAVAADRSAPNAAAEFGLGAASVFATIPYGILKFVFATLGGISGGLTYAFSAGNEKAAKSVWDTSLRGTYVITPEHLKGDQAIRFFGVPPEAEGPVPAEPALPTEPAR